MKKSLRRTKKIRKCTMLSQADMFHPLREKKCGFGYRDRLRLWRRLMLIRIASDSLAPVSMERWAAYLRNAGSQWRRPTRPRKVCHSIKTFHSSTCENAEILRLLNVFSISRVVGCLDSKSLWDAKKRGLFCARAQTPLGWIGRAINPTKDRRGTRCGVDGGFFGCSIVVFYCPVLVFLFVFNNLHISFKKSCSSRVLLQNGIITGDRDSIEQ